MNDPIFTSAASMPKEHAASLLNVAHAAMQEQVTMQVIPLSNCKLQAAARCSCCLWNNQTCHKQQSDLQDTFCLHLCMLICSPLHIVLAMAFSIFPSKQFKKHLTLYSCSAKSPALNSRGLWMLHSSETLCATTCSSQPAECSETCHSLTLPPPCGVQLHYAQPCQTTTASSLHVPNPAVDQIQLLTDACNVCMIIRHI